jgi:hypothetical protein
VCGTAAPRQAVAGQQAAGASIICDADGLPRAGQLSTSPRQIGTSPRQISTSPRQIGTSPRQIGTSPSGGSGPGGPQVCGGRPRGACDASVGGAAVLGRLRLQTLVQRRLPILVMHGDADQCVPVELSQELVRSLVACAVVQSSTAGQGMQELGGDEDERSGTPTLLKRDGSSGSCDMPIGEGLAATGVMQGTVWCDWADGTSPAINEQAQGPGAGGVPAACEVQSASASAGLPWELHIVPGGDHRLSSECDLRLMQRCVERLVTATAGSLDGWCLQDENSS